MSTLCVYIFKDMLNDMNYRCVVILFQPLLLCKKITININILIVVVFCK